MLRNMSRCSISFDIWKAKNNNNNKKRKKKRIDRKLNKIKIILNKIKRSKAF